MAATTAATRAPLIGAPSRCTMRMVDPLALRAGRSRSLADARSQRRQRLDRGRYFVAAHDDHARPFVERVAPARRLLAHVDDGPGAVQPRFDELPGEHARRMLALDEHERDVVAVARRQARADLRQRLDAAVEPHVAG